MSIFNEIESVLTLFFSLIFEAKQWTPPFDANWSGPMTAALSSVVMTRNQGLGNF